MVKRLRIYKTIFFGIAMLFYSCQEIIEPNISKDTIKLLSPADSVKLRHMPYNFLWEDLEGARNYRVQFASPSFDSPSAFYLDTVVENNNFKVTLGAEKYQWRVQGLNSGYNTAYTQRSFVVDSAADVGNQELLLTAPANNSWMKNFVVTFQWTEVTSAEKYILQLMTQPAFDTVVYTNKAVKRLPVTNQNYQWKVTAINSLGATTSSVSNFSIDVLAPVAPELVTRADTIITAFPLTLTWNRKDTDVLYDSLFLYTSDQITPVTGFPKQVNTSFIKLEPTLNLSRGNYYWSVRSTDRAGNVSPLPVKRKFTFQ